MKGRLRKFLSVLLVFCLMAAGAPAGTNTAWADDTVVSVTNVGDLITVVGATYTGGDTISIDDDITLTGDLTIDRNVTLTSTDGSLDAGEYKITIAVGADVTLQGDIAITGSGNPVIEVAVGASLTLEDDASVTQTGSTNMLGTIRNNGGDIEITGGSVTSDYTGLNNSTGQLTIGGGVIIGAENAVESYDELEVTGGTIGSASGSKHGIRVMGGNAFIEDGSVSALYYAVSVGSIGRAHITGGTFTASAAEHFALSCSSAATLIGGSFTGRVATSGTGTIDIAPGSSGLSLSDGVRYSAGGQYRSYFTQLPAVLPLTAKVGKPTDCTPVGADYRVTFELNGEADDVYLGVATGGNQVTMEPTTTGDYYLTLIAKDLQDGNGQTLKLTLPVTVSAADADVPVDISAIPGVTLPATGGTPVTIVETTQYTGGITWSPAVSGSFAPNTQYTATIVLGSKPGFTLEGVTEDFFTVAGATTVTTAIDSTLGAVKVTAVFPTTGAAAATKLATPGNLRWDNTTTPGTVKAAWDAVPDADHYLVTLYVGGMLKTSTNPTGTSVDFTSSLQGYGLGDYTFTVKAVAPMGDFSDSDVSEPSSPYTYTPVCMTSGTYQYYDSLDAALAAVPTGGAATTTINLLDDINHDGLEIDSKNVSIDPNGKTLTLGRDSELTPGLAVKNGGIFLMIGASGVNAVSKGTAVTAEGAGSHAMVYNATSTNGLAAYAQTGGKITVKNDAVGKSGIRSGKNGDTATSRIDVLGGVTATDDNNNGVAVDAVAGGEVTVYKDVTAMGKGGVGVRASGVLNGNPNFPTEVVLAGNVQAAQIGVDASSSALVTVNKNVTAGQGSDAYAYGVWAQGKAQVTVNGNVQANDHASSIGAYARSTNPETTTKITVDGTISGKTYIKLGNTPRTESEKDSPSANPGYHTYTDTETSFGTHTVWVKEHTAPANTCSIESTEYATLDAALATVLNGQTVTIKLLKNIDYNGGISIGNDQNKRITFDLNGFTLNVVNAGGPGLSLSSGEIGYVDATASPGWFNVTGTTCGVYAWWDETVVKVSNATATAPSTNNDALSYGVYARYGAQVTVTENATGNKFGAYADSAYNGQRSKVVVGGDAIAENINNNFNPRIGATATSYADVEVAGNASGGWIGVNASSSSTAKVGGNATGGMYGAYAELNSTTEVSGDAVATGQYGAAAYNGNNDSSVTVKGNAIANPTTGIGAVANEGSITIEGTITAPIYVRIGSTDKTAGQYTTDSGKPGYRKYTDGTGAVVWVKEVPGADYIYEIDETGIGYSSLDAALDAVPAGTPRNISLRGNATAHTPIVVDGKDVTFLLGIYTLTIDTSGENGSTALTVLNGGKADFAGSGRFNVIGNFCSVSAEGTNSSATVTNAEATRGSAYNVQASNGGQVIVEGDVICRGAGSDGVRAVLGGVITVEGVVQCLGENSLGVYSTGANSKATVKGGVLAAAPASKGVSASNGGAAEITGDITANKTGVTTYGTGSPVPEVTVTGNVTVTGVGATGDIEAVAAGGVYNVLITGNVTASGANSTGVYANGSTVMIGGKAASDGTGAVATGSGQITIEGVLTAAGPYIKVGGDVKSVSDYDHAASAASYWVYQNSGSIVSVKKVPTVVLPTVVTGGVTGLTNSAAILNGSVTSDGGAEITEYGFAWGASVNPTIISNNKRLGTGGISGFTSSLTGLIAGTTYHVRAYAQNSAGVAYGPDVSFTTLSVTPVVNSVSVSPATANVQKGATRQFSATVNGTNNPGQGVMWSVNSTVSSISATGLLTVAAGETKTTLTVTATSTVDNTKSGTATVTVTGGQPPQPTVTGIAVKTQPADLTYTAGQTLDLDGLVVTLTYNDSTTLDVDYEDFSYMGITANPAHGTALSVTTHHNKPVVVTCNGKTAPTSNLTVSASSGGGGGSGGSSAPASGTSIISDVAETAADRTLDQVLKEENQAVLSLAGGSSSNTAQISAAVIARLAEHETTFAVENTGVRLDFAPGALAVPQVTGGALVEIGAREITGAEREDILAQAPAGQSTGLFEIGGRIFDLTALVRTGEGAGQRIEGFGAPVAVTIDLSHLGDLTPEQISQLTGVRLEKDDQGNIVPVILGGEYDPDTRTFTLYTDTFSLYTVMRLEQAVQRLVVELAVGSAAASVNGSPYVLDAPPLVAEGRTLVPVRFVSEALGAKVTWDAAARRITVTDAGKVIVLTLGSSQAMVDGEVRTIDCPPATLPPGRTLVPLRFVGEALGAQVHYDTTTKVITVTR